MPAIALPESLAGVNIHFVGIKGTGMTALAELFYSRGAIITGSDVAERFYTDAILEKYSICVLPFSESNITANIQYVIYSAAYSKETNPDLIAAQNRRLPCLLYAEALGSLSRREYGCAVAGVHGKTSTTGLVGTIVQELDLDAQVLAGSSITSFGGSCVLTTPQFSASTNSIFVAETCEYRRHFCAFSPQIVVLTSVESDHQDYYPTYESIRSAFVEFICLLPEHGRLIYCADDAGCRETADRAGAQRPDIELLPYGETAEGDYRLVFGTSADGTQTFTLSALGECVLRVPGKHMVRNACAAAALVCELLKSSGKAPARSITAIRRGILRFSGGKRRTEIVGTVNSNGTSVIVIDDYAHYPTAIRTTLAGLREFYPDRKLVVDFMSHTYTRTAALLDAFAGSFSDADIVITHKIYGSARECTDGNVPVTGKALFEKIQALHEHAYYFEEPLDALDFLTATFSSPPEGYRSGYVFVTMGAGDNWKLGEALCSAAAEGVRV